MTTNNQADLEIIILNYNTSFWLKKTLSSMERYFLKITHYRVKVIVVDNASQDDSVEVAESFIFVTLIKSSKNGGFAKGNNLALKKASGRYIMLLNSDTEFDEHSNLDPLIAYLDKNKQVGALTPRLIMADGSVDLACHRGEPTIWASFSYFLKLDKIFNFKVPFFNGYHLLHLDLNTTHSIQAISGASFIIRGKVLKDVGLLDERFFMYAEDLDWCWRIRKTGQEIIYYPLVTIIHHKKKSGLESDNQVISKKINIYFYQTMLQYYDKHYLSLIDRWWRFWLGLLVKLKANS